MKGPIFLLLLIFAVFVIVITVIADNSPYEPSMSQPDDEQARFELIDSFKPFDESQIDVNYQQGRIVRDTITDECYLMVSAVQKRAYNNTTRGFSMLDTPCPKDK